MAKLEKIGVLNSLNLCLQMLKAFNSENFERSGRNRFSRNACFLIGVTIAVAIVPLFLVVLEIWYIFDNNGAIKVIVIVMPPALTIIQSVMSFGTFTVKNRFISGTIERIQNLVDKRKCYILSVVEIDRQCE